VDEGGLRGLIVGRCRSPPSAKQCGGSMAEVWRPATTEFLPSELGYYNLNNNPPGSLVQLIIRL